MVKVATTYELQHDDVLHILTDYFWAQYGIQVKPEEFHLMLQEGRVNEGYTSGPDQPARIQRIWFKK